MNKEYILIIDDNKSLCVRLKEQLEKEFNPKYKIANFFNATDAIEFIDKYIDQKGNTLSLVASDERLGGELAGHELLEKLNYSHPRSKKFIFSAWSDVDALISGINTNIDGFVAKLKNGSTGDEFFNKVNNLISDYEKEVKIKYEIDDIIIKQAETLFEKKQFLKLRYQVYKDVGHKTDEDFSLQEQQLQMEWDSFDLGGIDQIIIKPNIETRYLLAMKGPECIGGVRIIDGKCPLETGICVEEGFNYKKGDHFSLDPQRKEGLYTREISRLIVAKEYRKSIALIGLFRMIEELTREQNTMMCTSKEKQIKLYQGIGFEQIGPKISYSLKGEWIPMMRNWWKAHHKPETIEGMSKEFHEICTEPILASDISKWNEYSRTVNTEAVKTGFYLDYR